MSYDLVIVGVGGQGAILASDIIGRAAVMQGIPIRAAETHGMAQRGGAVENHVRIGSTFGSMVPAHGADLLMSMEPLEALRFARYLKKDGICVMNMERIVPVTVTTGKIPYPDVDVIVEKMRGLCKSVIAKDFSDMAKKAGAAQAMNVVMIGAIAEYLPLDLDVIREAVKVSVPPKTIPINMKAFEMGRSASN